MPVRKRPREGTRGGRPAWVPLLGLLGAVLASVWLLAREGDQAPPLAVVRTSAGGARAAAVPPPHAATAASASPFGAGAAVVGAERLAPHVLARQERMTRLAYATPERYYRMGLAQLQALAGKGDADAMLQLAEQYREAGAALASDPAYPRGAERDALANGYLESALNAGRSRAAALLARRFLDENRLIDAYAWHLMAQRTGGGDLFEAGADPFASLGEAEKNLANEKFLLISETASRARAAQMGVVQDIPR